MRTGAAIFVGGAIGALTRVALVRAWPIGTGDWPWVTLTVNILGAGLLGWVVVARPRLRPLLGTGLCGALTTFSTLQLELLEMLDRGRIGPAVAYGAVSAILGIAAANLGAAVAARGHEPR